MQGTAEVIPRSGASGERRGSREADEAESAVHGLLALRYTPVPVVGAASASGCIAC